MGNIVSAMGQHLDNNHTEEPPTVGKLVGACSRVKITKEVVAHVAIVAAIVSGIILALINANFFFLIFVGAGALGEGYFIYTQYKNSKPKENEQVET